MKAHINDRGEVQSVAEHAEGVASLAAESGRWIKLEHTMLICGLLHDIGKLKKVFDSYITEAHEGKSVKRRGEIDHSTAGGIYLNSLVEDEDRVTSEVLQLITTAVFSHHGLFDTLTEDGRDKYGERLNKTDIDYEEVEANCSKLMDKYNLKELFVGARQEIEALDNRLTELAVKIDKKRATRSFLQGCLQRLITSLLIDADRTDTARFMTGLDIGEPLADEVNALWVIYGERLETRLKEFKADDKISQLRMKMSNECLDFAKNGGGIYCLPVPTGGGKTLASLRFALEHCRLNNKQRIIYTAPYLSILEQNAQVIRGILKDDINILEHHSNIVLSDENGEEYSALAESWKCPVILTTMVRLLETLFSSKTRDIRRFNKLKNSVLIIDEVQSIPTSCLNLFNTMLNFLACICGTTVVLCSATQPKLDIVDKRLLYSQPRDMISNVDDIMREFKRVSITDMTRTEGYTTEELADLALERFDSNMLIILNTKSAVRSLYNELRTRNAGIRLYQLTTYMCAEHRSDVIDEIRSRLDKERLICVSTQLIEAGVDISFNNVIRSVEGFDSIIQAGGRCNRNGESACRELYIVNYNEESLKHLADISRAKTDTETLLIYYSNNADKLGANYLSERRALDKYYEIHYSALNDAMSYSLKSKGDNMFSLLSTNIKGREAYYTAAGEPYGRVMAQAYKAAGDSFEVIGGDTIGLVVPYKDSVAKLEALRYSHDYNEIKRLLKSLQRYTVNIYRTSGILKELTELNAVTQVLDGTVYVLDEGFYKEFGVQAELENYIFI